jgi:hypothetical protein
MPTTISVSRDSGYADRLHEISLRLQLTGLATYAYPLLRDFWVSELFMAESRVRFRMSRAVIDVGAFTWARIQHLYDADAVVHSQRCEAAGLRCQQQVFNARH